MAWIFYHINFDNIVKFSSTFVARDLPKITNPTNVVCKKCIMAKQKKVSFPSKKFTMIEMLEIIHTDLSRPTGTRGFYGERYFMVFVDDFTRIMQVSFLKEKYEAFEKFKIFKNRVENESGDKIKCLRSDRGEKFTSREFNMFFEENGIKRQLSSPKNPKKNGIAERINRLVLEAKRVIVFENDVSKTFQREVVNMVVYTEKKYKSKKV